MIVVDASVAMMWFLPDQREAAADQILHDEPVGPVIVALEIANALLREVRRRELSVPDYVTVLTDKLPKMIAYKDITNLIPAAAMISAQYGGAVYDMCYVALARQLGAPLATADRQQAAVAHKAGVEVKLIA